MNTILDFISAHARIAQYAVYILITLAVVFVAIRILHRSLDRAEKKGLDLSARPLIESLFAYAIYIIALLVVLHIVGVNTTGIVTMIGAASLAIGLAVKDALSNVAFGLLLLFLRPFKAGDYIECGDIKGIIVGIGLFSTSLHTSQGQYVSAPNSTLWGAPIVNFSHNELRRVEIKVGIDYSDSPELALDILKRLIESEPHFAQKPAPKFYIDELADSAVIVVFRAWAKHEEYFNMLRKYNRLILKEFTKAGLHIPFPQTTVHIEKSESEKFENR